MTMKRFAMAAFAAGSLAAASLALTSQAFAQASTDDGTFTASTTTTASISVSCPDNLSFGTLAVEPSNLSTTVTVAASTGAPATSSDTSVFVASGGGPAKCTVTNETDGNATASLSAATGTFSGTTLSGLSLKNGTDVLSADLELSKASAITNEDIFIGGTLTIPAAFSVHGTYTETVTLTITD